MVAAGVVLDLLQPFDGGFAVGGLGALARRLESGDAGLDFRAAE